MKRLTLLLLTILFVKISYCQSKNPHFFKLTDTKFKVGSIYILPDIIYYTDDYNNSKYSCLDSIIPFFNKNPKLIIEIGCHSDSRKVAMTLDTLTLRRSQQIIGYFIVKGVPPAQIRACGYAERVPRYLEKDYSFKKENSYCDITFKKGIFITEDFIKTLKTKNEREAAFSLNRRAEMKIIMIK
ncbi:MAG: OmpA family protein [Bacteroidetes bacterium]|nr:OmpA family protein [Bacteroidota bacterium]